NSAFKVVGDLGAELLIRNGRRYFLEVPDQVRAIDPIFVLGQDILQGQDHKIPVDPRQRIVSDLPPLGVVVEASAIYRDTAPLTFIQMSQRESLGVRAEEPLDQVRREIADVVAPNSISDEAEFL